MNCGECLAERVKIVELVSGVCPKCGTDYRPEVGRLADWCVSEGWCPNLAEARAAIGRAGVIVNGARETDPDRPLREGDAVQSGGRTFVARLG